MLASLQGGVGMGTRKMCQILGAFELQDFTMLGPVLSWCTF